MAAAADDGSENDESLQAALADLEMLQSAYPDEIDSADGGGDSSSSFPLTVTLRFSETASCQLQWRAGYPTASNIEIASSRARDSAEQRRLERALHAIRITAAQCLEDGTEGGGGLACCAAAMEAWNDNNDGEADDDEKPPGSAGTPHQEHEQHSAQQRQPSTSEKSKRQEQHVAADYYYYWTSGEPLLDRKSTFQAHLCRVRSDRDVTQALHQLLTSSSKMQRATHHMYAYRFTEEISRNSAKTENNGSGGDNDDDAAAAAAAAAPPPPPQTTRTAKIIVKHDNSDDGEDGAGARLAQLLQMRQDDGVLVVVSRWYGGVHLGPKRFAHIVNVARELLVQQQEQGHNNVT